MRNFKYFGLAVLTLAMLVGCGASVPETAAPDHQDVLAIKNDTSQVPAHELAWMAGCWQSTNGVTREYWAPTLATHMFGHSVTVGDGQVQFFEHMRIEMHGGADGNTYVFSAYPNGEGPSNFASTEIGSQTITFANAEHDYPQRIIYKRDGDTLSASISLIGGDKRNDWVFEQCP